MKNKMIYILLSCIVFFYGCATVYNPATQRNEFIFIDTNDEVNIGRDAAKQAEAKLEISYDPDLIKRVSLIGDRVALASDRKDLKYYFRVVEDKEVNAFALPGGYVYINTGLLSIINDDELAFILGHEIGHIAAKHGIKALQAAVGYNLFMSILLSKQSSGLIEYAGAIAFDFIHLKYSREDEILADKLGLKYAYLSGFDPNAALTSLEKLKNLEKEKDKEIVLFRSHPYAEQRIEAVKKEIDLIKQKQ